VLCWGVVILFVCLAYRTPLSCPLLFFIFLVFLFPPAQMQPKWQQSGRRWAARGSVPQVQRKSFEGNLEMEHE